MNRLAHSCAAAALAAALLSCANDTTAPPAVNSAPSVVAGADTTVFVHTNLLLAATAHDAEGPVVDARWTVLRGADTLVTIDSLHAVLTAPQLPGETLLCIVRVTDDSGASTQDSLRVALLRLPHNIAPSVHAGSDTAIDVGSSYYLRATASDTDGHVVSSQWRVMLGSDALVTVDTLIATLTNRDIRAGDTLVCIVEVTDDSGATSEDTCRVALLSWLLSPNGGEVYRIGDSLRIQLRPVYENVGLKLSVNDGEFLLDVPGLTSSFYPAGRPSVAFAVPDSIYDRFSSGNVSVVSDRCRIRVFRYNSSSDYVESDTTFAILPH
jgi:hypothetical protein